MTTLERTGECENLHFYASISLCFGNDARRFNGDDTLSVIGVGLQGIMYVCMCVTLFTSTHADKTLPVSVIHSRCEVAWPMHPSKNFQIFKHPYLPQMGGGQFPPFKNRGPLGCNKNRTDEEYRSLRRQTKKVPCPPLKFSNPILGGL